MADKGKEELDEIDLFEKLLGQNKEKYEFIDRIYSGTMSQIYRVEEKEIQLILKIIEKEKLENGAKDYLLKQIEIINPEIMIFCGATALKSFYDKKVAISKIRGEVLEIEIGGKVRKCIPIFHPSYLLRYHSLEEGSPRYYMLEDLKKIKNLIA